MSSKPRITAKFTPRRNRLATSITLALLAGTAFPATGWAATIQGYVFEDLNQNGIKDAGEPVRANSVVYINNNTLLDAGKGGDFTVTTNATGFYSSIGHTPGRFTLWTDVPQDWQQTAPAKGDGIVFYDMQLTSSTQTATVNFGLFNPNPPTNKPPAVSANTGGTQLTLNTGEAAAFNFSFTDTDSVGPYSYVFSFGDGSQTTGQVATAGTISIAKHTYTTAGTFTATLEVTDSTGNKGTSQVTVVVNKVNTVPTVKLSTTAMTAALGQTVTFNGVFTDPDVGDTYTYKWDFGDSSAVATTQNATHTYTASGTYTATFTVTDSKGGVSTGKITVTVNTVPTVKLTTTTMTAALSQTVTFNGAFTDSDVGDTHTYQWDFGDGSAVATTQTATHTYTAKGTYTATFTVTDSKGATSTGNVTVNITGAAPVVGANTGGETITINAGETVKFNFPFTDADGVGPYNYVFKFGDGNSAQGRVPITGNIAIQEHSYLQVGTLTAILEVTDKDGNKGTRQVTIVVKAVNADPCLVTPTVQSARPWGNWDTPSTWDTGRVPGKEDRVLIKDGNTVVLSNTTTQVEVNGLCIQPKGTLQSAFNILGSPSSTISLRTSILHNQGRIKGAEGVNASPVNGTYMRATAGSNIKLYAYKVINDETGYIGQRDNLGGRGGDDILYNYFPTLSYQSPAVGGNGGWVEIYPEIIINNGIIQAGDGGGAITNNNPNPTVNNANNPWWPWWNRFSGLTGWNWWWNRWGIWNWWWGRINTGAGSARGDKIIFAAAYGGQGGSVRVSATNLAESINGTTGKFIGGDGGFTFYHVKKGGTPGEGGNISVNLGGNFGTNGTRGGWAWWEPLTLQASNTTRFEGQDNIVIFGDEGASIDLSQLADGAITANKTITIAAGKGGTVDLRGLSGTVFKAGEKVEIFADNVQLDEGVTLQDLAEAPSVTVSPSKIIYVASWSNEEQIVGEPTATLPVHLTLLNEGPTADTYTVTVSHSGNATLGELPETVTVEGLRRTDLTFDVKLPATRGEEDVITVTATSKGDATVKAVANVRVGVVQPEAITPRQAGDAPADITLVIDNTDSMGGEILAVADALENFFGAIDPNTSPTVELITFKDQDEVISRVVTKDIADVIGRVRSIRPAGGGDCPNASVTALEKALAGINTKGQIILATAASAEKDANAVVSQLQAQGVKVNVLLAGSCDNEAADKAFYQNLATNTGGTFKWLPRGGDVTAADTLATVTTNMVSKAVEEVVQAKTTPVTEEPNTGNGTTGTTTTTGSTGTSTTTGTTTGTTGTTTTTGTTATTGTTGTTTTTTGTTGTTSTTGTTAVTTTGSDKASGIISDKFGKPVANATVKVGNQTVTTNAQGRWEMPNLPEGKYPVTVSVPGYVSLSKTCEVSADQPCSLDLSKQLSSLLKLKVTPQPAGTVKQGDNVTYTVTVTNTGTEAATGVVLNEVLPAATTLVSMATLNGQCDTNQLTCTLPDLAAGAATQVKLVVNNTQTNQLENTVTASSNNYPADVIKTWTTVQPYLSVTVKDTPDPVAMQGQLHYNYTVDLSKYATETATGISLVTQLPSGVEVQSAKTNLGTCDTSKLPTVTCPLPDLKAGSNTAANIDVLLKDPGLLVLTNEAKVTAANYPAHTVRERTNIFIPDNIKVDMAFVIDTTGSMQQEINGVIAAIKKFVAEMDTSQSPTMALIEFKDDVTVKAFTQDPKVLLKVAEGLKASGGGLCPEASAEALAVAVKHLKDGGVIMFSTDASPYDDADLAGLANLIGSKNMKFHAFVTGDCTQKDSWNELTK